MENNLAQTCYVVNPGISLGISYIKAANRVSMGIQNVISTLLLQQTVLLSTSMGRTYYKRASHMPLIWLHNKRYKFREISYCLFYLHWRLDGNIFIARYTCNPLHVYRAMKIFNIWKYVNLPPFLSIHWCVLFSGDTRKIIDKTLPNRNVKSKVCKSPRKVGRVHDLWPRFKMVYYSSENSLIATSEARHSSQNARQQKWPFAPLSYYNLSFIKWQW